MRKNKSMACVLAGLMIFSQPALCEHHHVVTHEHKINFLDVGLSSLLGSFSMVLGMELVKYLKTHFISLGLSRSFEFIKKENLTDTFVTVIGNNEAKNAFKEIINYLHNPQIFLTYGLKAPSGVLLYGEPGNGKTMLARAVAKEAGCNFIAVAGSELDAKYVGEGAQKVKALFNLARRNKPCIIFIDEIDAIGKKRTEDSRYTGVINQLLVEMDGFNKNDRMIVIGATNIPQILDPALLRAGRFDRKIEVLYPDFINRILLLKSLLRAKKNLTLDISDAEFTLVGHMTEGFSNADITHICNEIGLYGMRNKKGRIAFDDLRSIIEKERVSKENIANRV
jgi:cell division protease FtsH